MNYILKRSIIPFFFLLSTSLLYGQFQLEVSQPVFTSSTTLDLNNIFLSIALSETQEIQDDNGDTNENEEEAVEDETKESPNSELSYIPIQKWQKETIYWSIKGVSLALSGSYFIAEMIFPALDADNSNFNEFYVVPQSNSAKALFKMFDPFCHNLKGRSFQYANGNYMPLCARCTGTNIGILLGHFDSFIWDSFQLKNWSRWEQGLLHIGTYSLLTLPLIIDGVVQREIFEYTSNNGKRVVTGILFGYALTAIVDEILQLTLDYKGFNQK